MSLRGYIGCCSLSMTQIHPLRQQTSLQLSPTILYFVNCEQRCISGQERLKQFVRIETSRHKLRQDMAHALTDCCLSEVEPRIMYIPSCSRSMTHVLHGNQQTFQQTPCVTLAYPCPVQCNVAFLNPHRSPNKPWLPQPDTIVTLSKP